MKEFILYSRKGVTSEKFNLKSLAGSGGRMDLIARCVISTLWVSHKIRQDSRFIVSLNGPPNPPLALSFDGKNLARVTPDERNVALWIQKVLKKRREARGSKEWLEVKDGINLSGKSFQDLIRDREERNLYLLHEEGGDIREAEIKDNPVFIVGDHIGLPKEESEFAERLGAKKISLGPESYFSTQSIVLVHNELDRRR